MKLQTLEAVVIIAKGFCAFWGPTLFTYNVCIGQWANSDSVPSPLEWSMILSGSFGTGILGVGAFISSAFGKWMQKYGVDITNGKETVKP